MSANQTEAVVVTKGVTKEYKDNGYRYAPFRGSISRSTRASSRRSWVRRAREKPRF